MDKTDTRIIAATIAVIILESSASTITNKHINKRNGIASLIYSTDCSIVSGNQRNNKPATKTAKVILMGDSKASVNSSVVNVWLTITEATPIIKRNTSKLDS